MNAGLSDAPCLNFQFFLIFSQICLVQKETLSNFFEKKPCGGLPSCKPRYCFILHLEARGYFWLCGNQAFSETMRWVRSFLTAPWWSLGDLQLVVKDWAMHSYGGIQRTLTSYTKRCIRMRRVCWRFQKKIMYLPLIAISQISVLKGSKLSPQVVKSGIDCTRGGRKTKDCNKTGSFGFQFRLQSIFQMKMSSILLPGNWVFWISLNIWRDSVSKWTHWLNKEGDNLERTRGGRKKRL